MHYFNKKYYYNWK